ncbi:MAG: biopolymer transporter ExbD [Chthoniobacterales bacterium]
MKFYTKKRRSPTITIVSLIDILAILLIFFIVTTTFRKQEPALQIKLPESKTAEKAVGQKEPLILDVKSEKEITLDNKKITIETLGPELQKMIAAHPERPVAMRADRSAPFGVIVKVMDSLKEAGVKNIPTFTEPSKKP